MLHVSFNLMHIIQSYDGNNFHLISLSFYFFCNYRMLSTKKWIGIVITRKPLIHHTPLSKLTSWSPGGPVWISFCSSLFMAFWASNRVLSINWTSLPARRCPRTNADCKKKITKLSLIFIWVSLIENCSSKSEIPRYKWIRTRHKKRTEAVVNP